MGKADGSTLDRLYNNRALVPDYAAYFARWAQTSVVARQTSSCQLDVPYGDGPNEMLDIFPGAGVKAPVLVFLHGGYWRSLDKADHSFIAPAFTQAGACVVIPNYALCPAVTIPDIVLQMVKALAWTYRHVAAYGGDPRRITVVGHSAGGHLAAMLLACVWKAYAEDLPVRLLKNACGSGSAPITVWVDGSSSWVQRGSATTRRSRVRNNLFTLLFLPILLQT